MDTAFIIALSSVHSKLPVSHLNKQLKKHINIQSGMFERTANMGSNYATVKSNLSVKLMECGKFPPIIDCHGNVLSYYHRLLTMSEGKAVKSVFNMMCNLSKQGFQTWGTRVCELARSYHININETVHMRSDHFKSLCSDIIKQEFIDKWNPEISSNRSTILETYVLYKSHYVT